MKILAVAFAYNEIKYIGAMVNYYRAQGCDLNIVDNCSTDGTFQYLQSAGVRTRQKDTAQAFDLITLQRCLKNDLKAIVPDWVVYTGIDIIFSFDKTIRQTIEEAAAAGYTLLRVKYFNLYNTGEEFQLPMKDHYFYGRDLGYLKIIAKYGEPFGFEADSIQIKDAKVITVPGVVVNYGNCKPAAEREDTYRRRLKAWNAGLDRNYGVHYVEGRAKHWRWDAAELVDIRKTEYYKYIEKL